MASIAGVRLSRSGPVLYFDTGALEVNVNDIVVVETEDGTRMGRIAFTPAQVILVQLKGPVGSVVRVATEEDVAGADGELL